MQKPHVQASSKSSWSIASAPLRPGSLSNCLRLLVSQLQLQLPLTPPYILLYLDVSQYLSVSSVHLKECSHILCMCFRNYACQHLSTSYNNLSHLQHVRCLVWSHPTHPSLTPSSPMYLSESRNISSISCIHVSMHMITRVAFMSPCALMLLHVLCMPWWLIVGCVGAQVNGATRVPSLRSFQKLLHLPIYCLAMMLCNH